MSGDAWALTSPDDSRDRETDHAVREDDPTPRGVVRAALFAFFVFYLNGIKKIRRGGVLDEVLFAGLGLRVSAARPLRVLDVCAGYGAWASEFARAWVVLGLPREWLHITGVELFAPREPDLCKWCDEVALDDWREALNAWAFGGLTQHAWDIAIGNPHFTALAHEDPAQSMPAVLLEHAPAVLLLHTQQAFARGEAGRRVWRAYPPAASWIVPGSVKFRTGTNPATGKAWGSDSRCYQVSLWLRDHKGPTSLDLLPELDAAARRWTVPPGSEQPSPELPAAPGWAP